MILVPLLASWIHRRDLVGGVLVATNYCDDTCIFEQTRRFERAGRRLVVRQEFASKAGTGMGVWECSEVLSAYVESHRELVSGKRILELGCGGGALVSMVADLCGASSVKATDGDDAVLDLARRNLDSNDFRHVETAQLKWEQATNRHDPVDLVLAADVTYSPGSALPLANALLASGTPAAYIAHKRRTDQDDATLDTLAKTFGALTRLDKVGAVDILRFDRSADALPDLAAQFARVECNPGFRARGELCVPITT